MAVEIQREFDVLEKDWKSNVFFKVYVSIRDSGLLAAMSDREWKTLSAVACFMDEDGQCYPSQGELGRVLGVSVSTANERIQALAQFRFDGKPVLIVERRTRMTEKGPRFASNLYTILPVTHLRIFDKNDEKAPPDEISPVSAFPESGHSDQAKPRNAPLRK